MFSSDSNIIGISGTPQFPGNSPVMDNGTFVNPDYKNLQYDDDGNLNMEPDAVPAPSFIDQIKRLGGATPTQGQGDHCYENTALKEGWSEGHGPSSDDYVNDSALEDIHNYTNHDDLLMQVRKIIKAMNLGFFLSTSKLTFSNSVILKIQLCFAIQL